MIEIRTLADIEALEETDEVECKLASGQDGQGKLPDDFWPTYSAFANNRGGIVILGLKEYKGAKDARPRFELDAGIRNPQKVRTELFNLLNNRQKVSVNLLSDADVAVVPVDGKNVIVIRIPQATRRQKPVHLNGNPLGHTYRRLHEGDRPCDDETVKRMLAEQIEDSRDNRILHGYSFNDLSLDTLQVYRQALRDKTPTHPFLEFDNLGFLTKIGGWRTDRESGIAGLTVAGLLMFGDGEAIRDEFPNYFLDYQERPEPKIELRWVDRIALDGTWSGNIFDFYRKVYRKLVADLKMPFAIQDGKRQEDTSVHIAIREAFVNALVHADYTERASVLVVKRPDMFGFRNPGKMRIPIELAIAGGDGDGRNRTLQQMFLYIGAGEKGGTGVPKIYKGWADQHWRPPSLYEKDEPSEQTLLELRMVDLLPTAIISDLRERFGARFGALSSVERLILATAAIEQTVNHTRMSTMCAEHPNDLSRIIKGLVQNGFLVQCGRSRGSVYHLPGTDLPTPDVVFGEDIASLKGSDIDRKGSDFVGKGSDLDEDGSELISEPLPTKRGRAVDGLDYPLIDTLDGLDAPLLADLTAIAATTGGGAKVPHETMSSVVCSLCQGRYLTIKVLARLLDRKDDYLRQRILNPLVEVGRLRRAFPTKPNDPRQAYASRVESDDGGGERA